MVEGDFVCNQCGFLIAYKQVCKKKQTSGVRNLKKISRFVYGG